jgi:hypothetical protein
MAGQCVYKNRDLMREIYLFDPTFRIFFRENFVNNKVILEAAHSFWYEKYIRALRTSRTSETVGELRYILEIQRGFFDTLYQLSPRLFTP